MDLVEVAEVAEVGDLPPLVQQELQEGLLIVQLQILLAVQGQRLGKEALQDLLVPTLVGLAEVEQAVLLVQPGRQEIQGNRLLV